MREVVFKITTPKGMVITREYSPTTTYDYLFVDTNEAYQELLSLLKDELLEEGQTISVSISTPEVHPDVKK